MAGKGSKQWLQEIINFYKINRNGYPYELIYKLTSLLNVLEDTYSVSTVTELQEAIDNIGTDGGTIFIASGTYTVDATIDIDNCGSLVIYGHGDNTVLQAAAGVTIFNITCCQSCIIKTLKLDINNYNFLSPNTQAIIVSETNNNVVALQDVTIDGDGSNGIGIELQSNNCYIDQCNITDCKKGIYINSSDKHTISSNIITGHADYGIHASSANYLTITSNTCGSNSDYGIYLDIVTYSTISGNICNSNKTGIYCDSITNNTISNNSCSSNSENGIYITGCSYNTISSNTLNSNDSNSVSATAGLYITTNSDFNTISGNTVNNNNNSGVGIGYGIYIATATCDENVVAANNYNGNDIDIMDAGTATTVEYYVQSTDELQDAIDSIGSKAGVINIDASFTVSTTIDINGNGSYIIQGEGSNSTLTTVGDISCFYITSARSVLLRNLKIDGSSLTTSTKEIIDITETSNNIITLDNVHITGDGTNGYGIELNSENCRIENCTIDNVNIGINIKSNKNILRGNNCNNNATYGFYIDSKDYNVLSSNILDSNQNGIGIKSGDYNLINGNNIYSNTLNGIYVIGTAISHSDYNAITSNSCIGNDSNTANPQAGIYIDEYCDYTTVIGNTSINNNNTGVGTGYGIYNAGNTSKSVITANNCKGNDIQYWDLGVDTDIVYRCGNASEIQDAIDSIGTKFGTIILEPTSAGLILFGTTIDVDGGGSYIIEGHGDNTVLDSNGEFRVFNITNVKSCIIRDLKIDISSYIVSTTEAIRIAEASNNKVIIERVTIVGDGTNGRGVEVNSNNCRVQDCDITTITHGIYINSGNNNIIDGNICNTNNSDGIYLTGSDYNATSNNICNSNGDHGIYLNDSDYNGISDNQVSTNEENGIYLVGSDNNNINGNSCIGNDSNTIIAQAGIHITSDSNNNSITSNISINNNNAGAGVGYGIYIGNANCDDNIVRSNNCSGNDVNYKDIGTNTDIVYRCSTNAEIQDAIDSIAAKSGIIEILSGTITISTTIDVDVGGHYVIDGGGEGTVLTTSGDISCFNVTSAKSCTIKNIKIDASSLTTPTKEIIDVTEASNNLVIIDNITITGDGTNGYGIETNSNNCRVENCNISNVNIGIFVKSDNNIIQGNRCNSNYIGLKIQDANYNSIQSNDFDNNNNYGIELLATSFYNNIISNSCSSNSPTPNDGVAYGIYIDANCDYNIISNNACNNNDSIVNGAPFNAAGIYCGSNWNTIIGNSCLNTSSTGVFTGNYSGIYLDTTGSINSVIGNMCNSNEYGISCLGDNNVISGNICNVNDNDGVYLVADYCTIASNSCMGNDSSGILISTHNNNNIVGNTCIDNIAAIYLIGSNYNTVSGNSCSRTTDPADAVSLYGIWISNNSDENTIIGNVLQNIINSGGGIGYGLQIDNANCDNNTVNGNITTGNDTDYTDIGTGTKLFGDDTVYGADWNGDLGTATKNVIYDKIELILAAGSHFHDTDTLQLDGINSDGGAFAFTTTGAVTFNQNLAFTGAQTVDGVDISAFKTTYDAHVHDGQTLQLDGINSDGGAFAFTTTGAVSFNQSLTLATGAVITSADEDLNFIFGRTQIGSTYSDFATFSHRDMSAAGQYALLQSYLGDTLLNAPTGQGVYFRIQNVDKMIMTTSALTMSVPIAMGANDIINVGNMKGGIEAGMFWATYNFKDEADGTLDDNIGFIDVGPVGADTGMEASIVAVEDGHRKVLKMVCNGDIGTNAYWRVYPTPGTAIETIEFKAKYIDNGVGDHEFRVHSASAGTYLTIIVIEADTNAIRVYWGNGAGGNNTSTVACVANTWYDIKIELNLTTDLQSVWVNGISLISSENFYNDTIATDFSQFLILMDSGGGLNSLEWYIDAIGYSWDENYTVGDNYLPLINSSGITLQPTQVIAMNTNKITGLGDPTAAQDAATKIYVDVNSGSFPIGSIIMFSGAWTDNVTKVGWYKCDGLNGTVNLVDKFVRGGVASGATGGSDDAVVVSHTHNVYVSGAGAVHIKVDATSSNAGQSLVDANYPAGVSGIGANIPAYYTLIFIQRIS